MGIIFKDRQANRPNRYKATPDSGNEYYVTLERADEPTELGTPLSAENLNQFYSDVNKPTASMIGAVTADNNRTDIPTGSDLNSSAFRKVGAWRATTVAVASSIVNSPVSMAFTLDIVAGTGFHTEVKENSGYIIQKLTTNVGDQYFRRIYAGSNGVTVDSWKTVLHTGNMRQYGVGVTPATVE